MLRNRSIFFLSASLLFALTCVVANYSLDSTDKRIISIEMNLNQMVGEINKEVNVILSDPTGVSWSSWHNSFFLIDSTEVLAWSKNQFIPDFRSINNHSGFQLLQNNSGDFLIGQWALNESKKLFSVIPLLRKYPISNRYLYPEWNKKIFDETHGSIINSSNKEGAIINLNEQELFRFQIEDINMKWGDWSFVLATLSLVCFLVGIYFLASQLHKTKKFELVFIVLLGTFVLLRIVMVMTDYPARWITSSVFDPQNFASSSYNSSIGDLFLNSMGVLILCWYTLITYHHWRIVKYSLRMSGWGRYVLGCLFITLAFFSFLYPYLFVETIFHNSTISLDITETIAFDWLRSLSWLSVLVGAISSFFFVHIFINLAKSILSNFLYFLAALILAGVFFTAYFLNASRDYTITLPIAAIFFLILFVTNLTASLRKLEPITFIYFFVAMGALGIQHGISIKHFVEEKRAESQFKFASNYLIGRDVLGEYLLNECTKRIRQDVFIQSRINNPFLTKSTIRQKIMQVYLNSYFDRYEAQIYLYNSSGEPLDNNSPETLATFSNRFQSTSALTDYEGIYFIQPSDINSNKRYLSLIPISRTDQVVGFIIIDLSLKRIIPKNVYPELLVDRRFAEFFENKDRSFSFIKHHKIVSSFGTFNYEKEFDFSSLDDPDFYKFGITKNGYFHSGVEDVSGQVAVITSDAYPLFYVLTNFSLFFVVGVILLVFTMMIYGFISFINGRKMNYAARIQLYIYLAFSLPLFVATITTLNRVSKSAENELNLSFETNARNLSEGILSSVHAYFDDTISKEDLGNILLDKAKVTNSDITLYDRFGKYVASSQPLIVESQIISSMMNRAVWEKMVMERASTLINVERIGSLRFNDCYITLKSPESGELLGILSVPFFNSATSLEKTQVNVLSNFLTVFTFIFILFSILSYYVVGSLTFPLRFITRILSRTTLDGGNKPMEWKSNDEIGLMVLEYNKMVNNLEQSRIELARSQKESAWREIAKQVAHEIKNPLTPMKLTLQHMEYLLKMNKLDDEKTRMSITTLLTQVDILNEIASSFSAFARMPAPILTRIDLITLLNNSVNLYSDYEGGEVVFKSSIKTAYVMGDEQLLNRIFSNIILNGLQSARSETVLVQVNLNRFDGFYQVSIQDNGKGISPEMLSKLFIPYFSTKQSGSGLGLSISKQGIEQSGGEIWFDTRLDQGTTFYIQLPVVD